jgi:hypothetical protein
VRGAGSRLPRSLLVGGTEARKRTFFTHHLTDAVPNLHTRAPVGNPPLGPGDCRGRFYLRNGSGSLAIFAAIRRASSRVSSLAADRRQALAYVYSEDERGGRAIVIGTRLR